MQRRRVVITGLGILAPNGSGKEDFWQACLQGRSGVRAITHFDASSLPTRIAGEIPDFAPAVTGLSPVECEILDRGTQLAVAAAHLALQDAFAAHDGQLSAEECASTGVYMGTAMASVAEGENLWLQLTEDGTHPLHPLLGPHDATTLALCYVPAAAIAAHHRLQGPSLTITTGCSAGADAIGLAFWQIQEGNVERMLAGGSDAAVSLLGLNVFSSMRALSTRNDQPERASRPYDAQRDGFVLSEGAAVLFLEEREAALARDAHIYAEIYAYASNSNAHHMTALPEDGQPLQQLLQESTLQPEQIGYINSHGSSTRPNEVAETAAYKGCFGPHAYSIPISSTKSLIGHTQGAASAIELLVTALALEQQILPPTINQEFPDPLCDLDYIPNAARPVDPLHPLTYALTHSSGFGGANAALILVRHQPAKRTTQSHPTEDATTHQAFSPLMHYAAPSGASSHLPRRVVVTGLGVVAPAGIGKTAFWDAVSTGRSSIQPFRSQQVPTLPLPPVGQVHDFAAEHYLERKAVQRTDRMTHFTLAAVQEALQDAGLQLEMEDPRRCGAVIANTLGGIAYVMQQIEQLYLQGPRSMSAYTAIAWLAMANVGQTSIRYNLQGFSKAVANDLSGGLDALGLAFAAIRRGAADLLIAGGSEAPLHPSTLHILGTGALLGLADTVSSVYRPFDRRATGPLLAEGSGICVLEEYEHARSRNASIYGELIGYAQTTAPAALATPAQPDLIAYTQALRLVLAQTCLEPEDIACIYLDGRALPAWDAVEYLALAEIFGSALDRLACSVPRSQFGHSLAAAGTLDTICALLSLQAGIVPPTLNCAEPDPSYRPPGLVRGEAVEQRRHAQVALICSRSLGGSHVVLAVRKI